jgi:hypothetical protein
VVPTASSQFFVMPVDPQNNTGLPPAINDPGPVLIDANTQCHDDDTYEFAIVDDYEEMKALGTYTFNDSTSEVLPLAVKDWEPSATAYPAQWTTRLGQKNPCGPGSATDAWVLHLAGHFTDFGGGVGTVLFNHPQSLGTAIKFAVLDKKVGDDGTVPAVDPPAIPIVFYAKDHPYVPNMASADLTDFSGNPRRPWEGIAFWARRGPFAGPGFRPGILDRTTSDDFNKQLPASMAACRSVYTTCSCPNQKPCTPWEPNDLKYQQPTVDELNASIEPLTPDTTNYPMPTKGTYCWDPKVDRYPPWDPSLRCGDFACDYHVNTPIPSMTYNPVNDTEALLWDPAGPKMGIGTMTCSPDFYVFNDSTTPSAKFCYKPGVDLDPPERMERCNDGFLAGTLLTTDWHHYFIKFSDLRQGMIDKRSSGIDLTMVEALLFAFPGGDMDIWLDDVGFYRKKAK